MYHLHLPYCTFIPLRSFLGLRRSFRLSGCFLSVRFLLVWLAVPGATLQTKEPIAFLLHRGGAVPRRVPADGGRAAPANAGAFGRRARTCQGGYVLVAVLASCPAEEENEVKTRWCRRSAHSDMHNAR